jgi:hypothetical protein
VPQTVSRFSNPFDVARHPTLEPEVKRAILAAWASDASAVTDQPALRRPSGSEKPVAIDDVLAALRALDGPAPDAGPTMRIPGDRWRGRRSAGV